MRDFLDDLERRLAVMADAHPDLQPAPAPEQRPVRRRRRRPALLGGLTAVIAACAAAFTMTGTSLAELPILSTETQDASQLEARAGEAAKAGVDFKAAHVFQTPGGPGYVVVNAKTQTLCVIVPDVNAPGDYGVSCDQPISKIERRGLKTEMVGDRGQNPDATALVVYLLPEGADDIRLTAQPPGTTFDVESGIAVIETVEETALRWTVDGVTTTKTIEGPFAAAGSVSVICPDGSRKSLPDVEQQSTPQAAQKAFKAARKRACSR